jgi:hypothetical protein
MYPEYKFAKPTYRNLRILEGNNLVDEDGRVRTILGFDDLVNCLFDDNILLFVDDFTDGGTFPYLAEFVSHDKTKVLCDRNGKVLAIRVTGKGNKTRWIIQGKSWGVGQEGNRYQELSPLFLKDMWDLYQYVGVGMAPTPSSLGNLLMKYIYTREGLKRQTCISLAAENYLHEYSFGGIINSPGMGLHYDELAKIDMASAYLSKWISHPIGSAIAFGHGHCDTFDTYFASCDIEVRRELALGPFPVKKERNIVYPTLPGIYRTHLWKEQVLDVIKAGAEVRVISGIGWRTASSDCEVWAKHVYWLRKRATDQFIESSLKRIAVSAIGRHSTQRKHYYLVPESRADPGAVPTISTNGEPLRYFVMEDYDGRTGYLVHFNKYTIMQCNREVYRFALPYAEQGRLVQMYVDSVLATSGSDTKLYIKRYSNEALLCEPGTWLLEYRHNVDVIANGYTSDEENRLPGVKR